jgi:hypothetical protein
MALSSCGLPVVPEVRVAGAVLVTTVSVWMVTTPSSGDVAAGGVAVVVVPPPDPPQPASTDAPSTEAAMRASTRMRGEVMQVFLSSPYDRR